MPWSFLQTTKRNPNYCVLPASLTTSAFSHEGEIRPPPNSIQQTVVWASTAPFIWLQHQLSRPLAAHVWWYRRGWSSCRPNTRLHSHTHSHTSCNIPNACKQPDNWPSGGSNLDWILHFLFCLRGEKRQQRLTLPVRFSLVFHSINLWILSWKGKKRVFLLLEMQTQRLRFHSSC